jgi:hypothetical protein
VLSFSGDAGDLNATSGMGGYRLLFGDERTATTNAGGVRQLKQGPSNDWGRGCLVWDGSAAALKAELETLSAIDHVTVTRHDGPGHVNYTVTFDGVVDAGNVPQLTITDVGTDGCQPFLNASSSSPVACTDLTVEKSFVPLYKLQTTARLPYDATAADVKASIEALSAAGVVEVTRSLVGTGYTWAVTFANDPARMMEVKYLHSSPFDALAGIDSSPIPPRHDSNVDLRMLILSLDFPSFSFLPLFLFLFPLPSSF